MTRSLGDYVAKDCGVIPDVRKRGSVIYLYKPDVIELTID